MLRWPLHIPNLQSARLCAVRGARGLRLFFCLRPTYTRSISNSIDVTESQTKPTASPAEAERRDTQEESTVQDGFRQSDNKEKNGSGIQTDAHTEVVASNQQGASAQEQRESEDTRAYRRSRRPPRIPKLQPYSFPEPHLFPGATMQEVRERNHGKKLEEIPMATWYADQAAPPLLLTLDAFDTLYTPKTPPARQYAQAGRRYGYKVDSDQLQEQFRDVFKFLWKTHPNYGKGTMGYRDWWDVIIERTMAPFKPPWRPSPDQQLKDALFYRFATARGYKLFPDARAFLTLVSHSWAAREWHPKRTMLGIVSNSDPRVRTVLDSFGIKVGPNKPSMYPPLYAPEHRNDDPKFGLPDFAFATLSYECGSEKPSTEIYHQALSNAREAFEKMDILDRLTRTGKDVLHSLDEDFHHMHVGDSVDKDVMPALAAGWDAVLLDRSADEMVGERTATVKDMQNEEQTRTFTVINSLMALPHVVTKQRLRRGIDKRLGRESHDERRWWESPDPLLSLDKIGPRRERRRKFSGEEEVVDDDEEANVASAGSGKELDLDS